MTNACNRSAATAVKHGKSRSATTSVTWQKPPCSTSNLNFGDRLKNRKLTSQVTETALRCKLLNAFHRFRIASRKWGIGSTAQQKIDKSQQVGHYPEKGSGVSNNAGFESSRPQLATANVGLGSILSTVVLAAIFKVSCPAVNSTLLNPPYTTRMRAFNGTVTLCSIASPTNARGCQ